MSAPLPLNGTNPYTGAYQSRQFGVGNRNLNFAPDPRLLVFPFLKTPPAAGVTAEAVTPLEEQADVAAHPQQGIVPN